MSAGKDMFQQLVNQVQTLLVQLQQTQQALHAHQQQATAQAMVPPVVATPACLKINCPSIFNGQDHCAAHTFLTKCCLEFEAAPQSYMTDQNCVHFTASYLTGMVFDWIAPHLDTLNQTTPSPVVTTWDNFITEFLLNFSKVDKVHHAAHTLAQLQQTTSVSQYTTKFQIYTAHTMWNDAAKHDMFYNGLKVEIQVIMASNLIQLATLAEMCELTIQIDNRVHATRHLH